MQLSEQGHEVHQEPGTNYRCINVQQLWCTLYMNATFDDIFTALPSTKAQTSKTLSLHRITLQSIHHRSINQVQTTS